MTKQKINIGKSLDILGLKPAAQRVLLIITEYGTSSVVDIASHLNMPKSSVYDALSELVQKSLVTEYSDDRGKSFGISEKEQLARVHGEKIEELQSAHASLISFIQDHGKDDSVARPKIKFYAGVQGIKQAFRDMSWSSKYKDTYLMWPIQDMIETLGVDFLRWHSAPRLKIPVTVNAIEKYEDREIQKHTDKYDWLEKDNEKKPKRYNKMRYLPKGVNWQMSYWLYGDKCLFASGGSEKIAFTIHSKEFCDMIKIMWQKVWDSAEE
jgi:sugar-specific transcriptional regulator TrmB